MKTSNVSALNSRDAVTGVITPVVVLADVVSDAIQADQMLVASAQVVLTGSGGSLPTGNLKFQFSNDPAAVYYKQSSSHAVSLWTDIGSPIAVAAAGTFGIPKTEMSYQWVRLNYDNTAAVAAAALTNQSLTYTVVTAGVLGNAITIRLLDPSAINALLIISVVGTAITASLATNGAGTITSTGDQVKAAINASLAAAALVLVSGTNGSAVTAIAATPLAGGTDGGIITFSQVKTMGY